nr:protein FRIGIDA-ESSENTIAL 1-like isoform X1 [Ipomoea batatas]
MKICVDNFGRLAGNKTHRGDANISLHGGGVMPEKAFGCEINAAMLDVDPSSNGIIGVQYSKDMADQEAAQAVEDMEISPRSDVPQLRPRSLSPGAEFNDKNKRPAIICDFFAKGWCIKGSSCRFLHVRDNAANSSKEGSVDASKGKGILAGEGLKYTTEISAKNMHSDLGLSRIEHEATLRLKSGIEEVPLDKNLPVSDTSFKDKDIGREYLEHKPYLANYNHSSSMFKDYSQTFGNSSFGRGLPSENCRNVGYSSYFSHLEGIRSKGSQFLHDDHPSNCPAERVPLYPSASWNASPLGLQKPIEGGKGSVSFKHKSPPFTGSESTLISHPDLSAPTHHSSLYRPKLSFDNWEPSVPFQPSFLITQRMLSEASQYDPIRDSIEQTVAQDKPSQFPFSGQGASVSGTHVCENADPVVTGNLGPEQSSNKHSVSSHSSHKDAVPRNLSEKEKELMDTAGVHQENIYYTSLKEKQLLKSADFGDTTEADKTHFSNDTLQKNGAQCKMELKVERVESGNDVDGLVHQDSRALKQFRSALVEFIKELLKPTWQEGLLSRDAYKVIVKKTAAKFLSTMQPEQIPDNSDSSKEYLSFVQPKLEKLVLGNVDKYGRS